MSSVQQNREAKLKKPGQQRGGSPLGRFGGGPVGMPGDKAKNFKRTFRRLLSFLMPHRTKIMLVFVFAILSTAFGIAGPKILGMATTRLLDGIFSKVVAHRLGQPSPTIDFVYIGTIILILIGLYLISSLFM